MRWKRILGVSGVVGVVVLIGAVAFGCWLVTPNNHQATLVKLDVPGFASAPCLGRNATLISGLRLDVNVEWVTEEDLVVVLNRLTREGWYPISSLGPSMALLPAQRTVVNLWLVQVPVLHSISLAHTEDYLTRLTESTSLMFCPPVL